MPENTILSGIAICYGPLALTILGFIFFAWLTDTDARRKYLRRPRSGVTFVAKGGDVNAETPSGAAVTIKPTDAAAPAAPAPAKPTPPPAPAAPSAGADEAPSEE